MSKPVKREVGDILYFRKAVPKKLQSTLGKAEIKTSLGTRSMAEAQAKHAELERYWERVFQSLLSAMVDVTHRDIVGLAALFGDAYLKKFEDNPHSQSFVEVKLNARVKGRPLAGRRWGEDYVEKKLLALRKQRRNEFRKFLLGHGINLGDDQITLAMPFVFKAICKADLIISEFRSGNYSIARVSDGAPPVDLTTLAVDEDGVRQSLKKHGTQYLFDEMAKEREFAASTIKRWRPIIVTVAAVHPDLRTITRDWCVDWKNRLLARGLATATVQNVYLSALGNLCRHAIANGGLSSSPMEGLFIKVARPTRKRTEVGFTEAETRRVLSATLNFDQKGMDPDQVRARRWLPWFACYTGARVGELAQLRTVDLVLEDGVWVFILTPEAGPIKDKQARRVPLHPHLLAQGAVEMIRALPEGRVFCDPAGKRSPTTVADDHGRWIREIGLTDPDLQPAHGWRHRFKTVSRRVKMDPPVRDYMQGHVPHNEAEGYGNQEAPILLEWLSLLKWVKLDDDPSYLKDEASRQVSRPTLAWSRDASA